MAAALAAICLSPPARAAGAVQDRSSADASRADWLAQATDARSEMIVPPVPRLIHRWNGGVPRVHAADNVIIPPVPQPAVRPLRLASLPDPQVMPATPPAPRPATRPVRHDKASEDLLACLKPAARQLLQRIEREFGAMKIVSTCRPGARIAGSGRISKHATGEAIDFDAGSRKNEVVRWLIANHKTGGVMTYSDMSHVHVDVGHHFVALNAPSGR
ncbi:MAG TPA: D-Ala-D-Ala carboxypeptidase family metallohydrolase [Hyphomicrobiaceae bacterium]|jgi:hypothetical protein|nr:D-Ala-D-Ala carboxypeptidase family metallohydrolase [Hyphomicrobiaceae bacterium]